jgi:inositol 1,4,5-triphosphate receptor type 1
MAEQRPLHIGDTVLFMVKLKEHHVGYISSELSSSSYNFLTVKPAQSVANSGPCFTDVSCVTFKIIAPKKSTKQNNFNQVSNSKTKQKKQDTKVFYGDSIQLQHVGSKKFIQVCSEASQTESNNLLLALSADDSKGCTFRLLPRYKVRSEGDEVTLR